jgi:hypothetical protein
LIVKIQKHSEENPENNNIQNSNKTKKQTGNKNQKDVCQQYKQFTHIALNRIQTQKIGSIPKPQQSTITSNNNM